MRANRVNFDLSHRQKEIINCEAHRIVVPTGRRFGKSFLCRRWIQTEMFKGRHVDGYDLIDSPVLYVAPTLGKAEKYMWRPIIREFEEMGILKDVRKKKLEIEIVNGRQLWLASADRPDSLRGDSLSALVIDETKDVKREAIEDALSPALLDKDARALFVGSPQKGTYFEELYKRGRSAAAKFAHWASFTGTTYDNPSIRKEVIDRMKVDMLPHVFEQEVMGRFVNASTGAFDWKILEAEDFDSLTAGLPRYIAIDLAGFTEDKTGKRDNHSIAVVAVGPGGWYVEDVIAGTWEPRETAARVCRAWQQYKPIAIGAEGGALRNAFKPTLMDYARKFGMYFEFEELTHGGKRKQDRIAMALLVRSSQGRLFMRRGAFNDDVKEESDDFPNPLCHDDRIDSIAYVEQLAETEFNDGPLYDEDDLWVPYDEFSGY